MRFGRLSVGLNTDGSCVFETRRAARLLQQFGGFPFAAADDRLSPPCDLDAPHHRRAPCSIGRFVRCHIAREVPVILPLEHLLSGGGDAVVKVQGVARQLDLCHTDRVQNRYNRYANRCKAWGHGFAPMRESRVKDSNSIGYRGGRGRPCIT